MPDIIAEPKNDFSHDHFEYCYVFLAQQLKTLKLKIKRIIFKWLAHTWYNSRQVFEGLIGQVVEPCLLKTLPILH